MKKLLFFLLVIVMLSVAAFADGIGYSLKVSYNPEKNGVTAELYTSEGESVVAHIGFVYNTAMLELVSTDYSSIQSNVSAEVDSTAYINSIVKSDSELIHITPENASINSLINKANGLVMFGWYADLSVDSIPAGTKIATFNLKIKDGFSYSNLSAADIIPAPSTYTKDIADWQNGIMGADSKGDRYYYEPAEGANKINVAVELVPYNADLQPETTTPEAATPTVPTPESTIVSSDSFKETDVAETENIKVADFGLKVKIYEDRVRVFWDNPEKVNVSEFGLLIADNSGNAVRKITGITNITKSYTIKNIAQDYEYCVSLVAVKPDGAIVAHNKLIEFKTVKSSAPTALIYSVTYKAGAGSFYGMQNEQVVFGSCPTKAPTVYAPEGYEFAGWSIDGKNAVNLDELKIYADTELTAVYTKVQ